MSLQVMHWKIVVSKHPYVVLRRGIAYIGQKGWVFDIKDDRVSPESIKFLKREGFTKKMIEEINEKLRGERSENNEFVARD